MGPVDAYDNEAEDFPLAREAAWCDIDPPPLDWDESEVSALVDDIVACHLGAE